MAPARILMVGHSFVDRLHQYNHNWPRRNFRLTPDKHRVKMVSEWQGTKLRTIRHLQQLLRSIVAYYQPIDVLIVNMGCNDLVSRVDVSAAGLAYRLVDEVCYILDHFQVNRACFVETIERFGTQCFPRRTAYYWGHEVNTIELAERWYRQRMWEFNGELHTSARQHERLELLHYRGVWVHTERYLCDGLHFNQRGTRAHWKSARTWIVVQTHKSRPL